MIADPVVAAALLALVFALFTAAASYVLEGRSVRRALLRGAAVFLVFAGIFLLLLPGDAPDDGVPAAPTPPPTKPGPRMFMNGSPTPLGVDLMLLEPLGALP